MHHYLSPGKIYKLLEFSKSHEFDLKKLTLKKLLKKIIKFELNYSIEKGLKNTIEWYKKNSNDSK